MERVFTSSSRHCLPFSSLRKEMMHVSRHLSNQWKNDHVVSFRPRANRMSTYAPQQRKPFSLILPRSRNSPYNNTEQKQVGMESTHENSHEILRSGMLLLKNYLTLSQQVEIVNRCEELGVGPGGFYQQSFKNGPKLRIQRMCLGKNWDPNTHYKERFRSYDGAEAPPIPDELSRMVKDVVQASQSLVSSEHELPLMSPDDHCESPRSLSAGLPVVSFSIGDSADFLYGDSFNADNASSVLLESGDVLIFGGKSRLIYHGVNTVIPNSAPRTLLEQSMLRPGRLSLTFREY
ncbi:hypothetical protein OSB04_020375 [Centaurea solstitialis]|uniref:Alpha-ketoglutarate-dependent dioxygenase AlkB-like domain-containing protein n=1 Tax=Centaurea solstitialis TaxID=347529 RepID=A0AA38W5U1_9ASTR|nr:hypothetical protein OSB04_020375 [Centaurea solstitialis]